MRRREFTLLLAGASIGWPLAARAQQSAMPVVGFISSRSRDADAHLVAILHQSLKEAGYVEGHNVAFEYRWAEGRYDRLPTLAADLVHRQVAVIVAGANVTALAAKASSTTIPIFFVIGGDPVKLGLVASFNQPGGNVTGITFLGSALLAKQFELLHKLVPTATTIGVLVNPTNPDAKSETSDVQAAASALGNRLLVVNATAEGELDTAFATLVQQRADALLVGIDPFLNSRADQIVALATRYGVPAIYPLREYVTAGGLMSYAASLADAFHQAGIYIGRILKGEKPSDLPVIQSNKLEFVLNLKAAKALGLDVPPTLLATADEVIE
jgi:putative tryptophan/tyrosine transport system substrate-binding protein